MSRMNSVTRLGGVEFPSASEAGHGGRPQYFRWRLVGIAWKVVILGMIFVAGTRFASSADATWAATSALGALAAWPSFPRR